MLCPHAGQAGPPDGTWLTTPRGWCTTGSRRIRRCMSGSNRRPRSGDGEGTAPSTTVRWPRSCAGWDWTHGWCTQPGFASITTRSGLWATRGSGSDSTARCATSARVRPATGPGLPLYLHRPGASPRPGGPRRLGRGHGRRCLRGRAASAASGPRRATLGRARPRRQLIGVRRYSDSRNCRIGRAPDQAAQAGGSRAVRSQHRRACRPTAAFRPATPHRVCGRHRAPPMGRHHAG